MVNREQERPKLILIRNRLIRDRERMTEPWRLAIFQLREQLREECLNHKAGKRRFQQGRLIENFVGEIKPNTAIQVSVMSYWLFCGSPWQDELGYNEARQQHHAELKALGLRPGFHPDHSVDVGSELLFRLSSLASWIEAHEGWIIWKGLNQRAAWDSSDPIARRQALDAAIISKMPTIMSGISDWGIGRMIETFCVWNPLQWKKVLKSAAHLAEKRESCPDEDDAWVWWRYPIFRRYRWSSAEVYRAALEKFGERAATSNEAAFQAKWVRRGLRFTGKKRRKRQPPLWEFVINEEVPTNIHEGYSMLTWMPHEKSRAKA